MPPAGQALLQAALALRRQCPATEALVQVRGIACLGGCERACTIALQAPGRHAYLFGGLAADAETAAQVLEGARLHARSAEGLMARAERPPCLRRALLAKLPPYAGLPT